MPKWLIERRKPYSSLMSPVIFVGSLPQISTITNRAAASVTSRALASHTERMSVSGSKRSWMLTNVVYFS